MALTDPESRAMLAQLIQGQEKLRTEINNNFVLQATQLEKMMDSKLNALRVELDGKMRGFTAEIQEVRVRMAELEQRPSSSADVIGPDLEVLRERITAVEAGQGQSADLTRNKLIVKGLPDDNQDEQALMRGCEQLMAGLQLQVRILHASHIGAADARRPRPVAMTLSTVDDVKTVMRNKRKLRDTADYKRVYIEPDQPLHIRALEANMRRVTKELPNLEYRRGRVVAKDQPNRDATH